MKIFYKIFLLSILCLFSCQANQVKKDNNDSVKVQLHNYKNKYDFPIELNIFYECPNKTEKLYKIDKDLNFEYFENENTNKFKISDNDKRNLIDFILKNDIYELNKNSEKIPIDAPQTEECREIYQLSIIVENKSNLFELNDRKFYHTKEYIEAFNNIKNKLDEIKKNNSYSYSLPIVYKEELELNGKIYEIKIDKDYILEVFNGRETIKNKIKEDDVKVIIQKLNKENINKLFEKSEKIPDNVPQTKELRTIMTLNLNFNNNQKVYDRNSRSYIHTKEYINSFDSIVKEIKSIVSKYYFDKDINLGEELLLKDNYFLKAVRIIEDSRCPENARCIWAGRLIIKFQILKNNIIEDEFELNIPEKDTFENTLFKIKLLNLTKLNKIVLQIINK
jgi:NACalpha-BTF3-like transcription factor